MHEDISLAHTDRVVVISGGVRGIGRALTDGFLRAGARVVAFHRGSSAESQDAEATMRCDHADALASGRLLLLCADVAAARDRRRVLYRAVSEFGRLDVLVNNAGVCYRTDLTPARVQQQRFINATAPLRFSREAAEHIRRNLHASPDAPTRGSIIAISSYVTEWRSHESEYLRHYARSKRLLEQGMRALALALRPDDINVNTIAVGVVYAGMGLATIRRKEAALHAGALPVTKFATVDCVVFEALHLTHPRSHYKTGRVEVLDGGWNLGESPGASESTDRGAPRERR
jgi:NAD(P)-dependent dehydrogenase (short-subunit alcohol dehydrogenase family)